MKKIALVMAAIAILFTSCNDDKKSDPSITLTNEMVQVSGLSQDYITIIDNAAKTIDVEVAYVDRAELAALDVAFVSLPVDVSANSFSFNFSGGAVKEVVFAVGDRTVTYMMTASAGDPDPKFVTAALNEVAVASGEAKLRGMTDLKKVAFTFTVSPEDTKVYVGNTEIESGAEVDFSDKLNGVTFTLKCAEVSKTETIKVVTSGISSVERVWGHYVKPTSTTDDWFGTSVAASNWERNISLDDKYVYMARAASGDSKGMYAVSLDGKTVKTMSTNGLLAAGVHQTSAVAVMNNGSSSVTLLTNMVNAANSHLYVYAYDNVDADPRVVLDYTLTEAARLGDKLTVEGDWQDGKLWFYNYNGGNPSVAYCFTVKGGTINATPEKISLAAQLGNIGGVYKYSDTEYMWAGAAKAAHALTLNGGKFEVGYALTDGARFSYPMHGVSFFTFNDQKYMCFVRLLNSFQNGAVRIMELNYDTLAESLEKGDVTTDLQYELGDPTEKGITAAKNGNGCGSCEARVINGETYIAACVMGSGVSLFKLQ